VIGKALYYLLSNDIDVSGIVGTRIYQDMPPQDSAFPFIVYTVISTAPTNTKDYSTKSVLDAVQVQIDMYSRKVTEINNLATYVRNQLDGYTGTQSGSIIRQCRFLNDSSGDPELEIPVYFRSQDYEIHLHKTNS